MDAKVNKNRSADPSKKESLKLIILEDNKYDYELIRKKISSSIEYDCVFEWVTGEKDFKNALVNFRPDMVLSDYNLPQYNGLEALKLTIAYNDLVPFIIVTGTMAEEVAAESIKEGAWDYVVKERLHRLPKAMENALKLKKERLRSRKAETELNLIKDKAGVQLKLLYKAIENAPSSFIITDANGTIQYVNPRFEEVTGYSAEEAVGENPRILKSGLHNDSFYKNFWATISSGKEYKGEIINRKKNGELFWEMFSVSPIQNDAGEIEHFVAVNRDITENKKVEQELIESENWYRAIFENTGTATCILDNDKYIVLANSKFEELSGFSQKELEGKRKWTDFVTQEDLRQMEEYHYNRRSKIKPAPRQYEFHFIHRNGDIKNILLTVDVIPGTDKSVASLLDITDRYKMEEELKASQQKYQNLAENINEVLYETDTDGIITYISPTIESITGYPDNFYFGKSFFDTMHEKDRKIIRLGFSNALHHNQVEPNDFRIKTKNGNWVWMRSTAKPILVDDKSIGLRGLAADITTRKETEKELIRAKEKAEESDHLKSAFLATMSHELRTPLNAIIGFSEMIVDSGDYGMERGEMLEMSRIINKSGKQLLSIIEDIFEMSMLQTKVSKVVKEKIKISEIFGSLTQYVRIEMEKLEKTHLVFNAVDSLPHATVYTDKTKINQLLTNLLKNAIKFTDNGHIILRYSIKAKEIKFYVEDTGIGIPSDKIDIVFKKFRQVDDSHTRKYGGVGLGLAICSEIANTLNGKLEVESQEGKGTTFCFTLKDAVDVEGIPSIKDDSKIPEINLSGYTILVVEDVESNFLLLKNYLALTHASVRWARNGEESIEICRNNPDIDLVLMDIRMPGIDGFETTRRIKAFRPELKIIAQTAFAMKEDKKLTMEANCDDYMSKPIRLNDFIKMLVKHLDGQPPKH